MTDYYRQLIARRRVGDTEPPPPPPPGEDPVPFTAFKSYNWNGKAQNDPGYTGELIPHHNGQWIGTAGGTLTVPLEVLTPGLDAEITDSLNGYALAIANTMPNQSGDTSSELEEKVRTELKVEGLPSEHVMLGNKYLKPGVYIIKHRMKIASDWTIDTYFPNYYDIHTSLWEFKQDAVINGIYYKSEPCYTVLTEGRKVKVTIRFGNDQRITQYIDQAHADILMAEPYGWVLVFSECNFTNQNSGYIRLWFNDTLVFNYNGPTLQEIYLNGSILGPYYKFGAYERWLKVNQDDVTGQGFNFHPLRRYFMDLFEIGKPS